MPRTTYIATHDGHTFQRTSAHRVYTHAVLVMYDLADSRAHEQALARKRWQRDHAYCLAVTAGTDDSLNRWRHESEQDHAKRVERVTRDARDWLANPAESEEAFVARCLQQFEDGIGHRSSDGLSYYRLPNWCGRLDLAEKQARRESTRRAHYRPVKEVYILPASVKRGSK